MKEILVLFILVWSLGANGQIFEETQESMLGTFEHPVISAAWGDLDNDGAPDLFMGTGQRYNSNLLFRNKSDGSFGLFPSQPYLFSRDFSPSAAWGDFSGNGNLDLVICQSTDQNSNYSQNSLYNSNSRGQMNFVNNDSTYNEGDKTSSASWVDYDRDGDLDLFFGNSFVRDKFFENKGIDGFDELTNLPFVLDWSLTTLGIWADYDNDRWPDLLVLNENGKDFLYRNMEGNGFELITNSFSNSLELDSKSASWGDYDQDGFLDLIIVSDLTSQLYKNNGNGQFSIVSASLFPRKSGGELGGGSTWGDFDSDGDLDLVIGHLSDAGNQFYENDGNGGFLYRADVLSQKPGLKPESISTADYNMDGHLDLMIAYNLDGSDLGVSNFMFKNLGGNCKEYFKIQLAGITSNTTAIGAKIHLWSTRNGMAHHQMRHIASNSGFAAQNEMIGHFGLERDTLVDSILVEWPSGIDTWFYDLKSSQYIKIYEDGEWEKHTQKNQPNIVVLRSELCPANVTSLSARNFIDGVEKWYIKGKEDEILSTNNSIFIAKNIGTDTYVAEGKCGQKAEVEVTVEGSSYRTGFLGNVLSGNSIFYATSPDPSFLDMEIYNRIGQLVREYHWDLEYGESAFDVNFNDLGNGLFYIKVKGPCQEETFPVFVGIDAKN